MDKKKIYVKISGFVGLVMTFILLSGISVLATEQQAQGDLIIDTDVDEGYAYVGDGVQLLRGYEIMKGGTYKVSMAEGVTQTNEVILIDSNNPVILELDNVKISSLGLKQYFFGQTSYGTYYGAPAIWIDTNLQTDVTIIYKGDCYLKGSNQWAAIMKYNRDTGGKLTLRSSGSDDDVLKLEGACGIGSHSDAASMSDNVCIENGHIIGSFGAEGVSNYVINDGYHVLEQRNSNSSTTVYPGIGTCTINGGTIVTRGSIDSSVVTYKGGNLYSKKEIHVVDGAGEETKLVVFPADEKLTGVVIDGDQSPCTANNSTNYQLYTFLTRKEHTVKLIFTDREEEYTVSFIGDKPIVTGDGSVSVTYPDWTIQSIEKAEISGVPESMYYTGKRITIPELKVTLDGYELIPDNDYTVTYTNNKEVGRASFSVKGINSYKGILYGNFQIIKKPEENNNNNNSSDNNNSNSGNNSSSNNGSGSNSSSNNSNNNNNNNNNTNSNSNNNNTTEYVPPTPKPAGTTLPKSNYGSYYKVTSSSSSNPTATFTKPANKNTYSVYIDSMVYDAGVYYTVTTISDNAFKGCKNITYLSVPYSINKIGKNAFKDCKKLETFTIYTTKLNSKNVGKNAFKGITKKTKIRVPKSKKKAYTKLFRKKGLSKKVKIVGI